MTYNNDEHPRESQVFKPTFSKKDLKNTTGLFVDETRHTLHISTTCEMTNGRLRDTYAVLGQPQRLKS